MAKKTGSKATTTTTKAPKAPKAPKARRASETAKQEIQAVHENLAQAGGRYIGSLIYWNAGAIDLPRSSARALFGAAQFEHLIPAELAHGPALTRAATEGGKPKGFVIRPFSAPNADTPVAFGVYRVESRKGEGGDGHTCGARIRVDPVAGALVALPPEGGEAIPEAMAIADGIAEKGNRLVTHVVAKDVSAALSDAARELNALPLRDQGGVYLLPPASESRWLALETRLREMGFRPSTIKMHDAPENIAAARDAAQGALEGELCDLAKDLDDAQQNGMRCGTIEKRLETLAALRGRTELYRNVLEGLADDLAAKAREIEVAFEAQLDRENAALKNKDLGIAPPQRTAAAKGAAAASKAWETRRAREASAAREAAPALSEALVATDVEQGGEVAAA